MIVPRSFYEVDTVTVAKRLLGCCPVHLEGGRDDFRKDPLDRRLSPAGPGGALVPWRDPGQQRPVRASRPRPCFLRVWYALMHERLHLRRTRRETVLRRDLEPVEEILQCQKRRGLKDPRLHCSSSGRLTQALAITGKYNGSFP